MSPYKINQEVVIQDRVWRVLIVSGKRYIGVELVSDPRIKKTIDLLNESVRVI